MQEVPMRDQLTPEPTATSPVTLIEALLAALVMTGICYFGYFAAAPWIWGQNMPFKQEDITPWVITATREHDGVEIYALYLMTFINCAGALLLSSLFGRLAKPAVRYLILGLAGLFGVAFLVQIGFIPPMNNVVEIGLAACIEQGTVSVIVVAIVTASLWVAHNRAAWLGYLVGALLLIPTCFLAISAYGWRDYTYIFAPAMRLLDGAAPSQIYFQYDLLPSLLAAAWMKLGIHLKDFRVLGQAAYYLAFLTIFIFSSRLFKRRELSALMLVALVLGRIYASPYDATLTFQTTPIRLDLWIPLLLVVHRLGPYHWAAGLGCGLLVLLLKNFGIIYSLAYVQLLIVLWILDYFFGDRLETLPESLLSHARRCAAPLVILGVCAVTSFFLFRNTEYGNFAGYYQKLGIGFIQIADNSFFWYVFVLFCCVLILLFSMRNRLTEAYRTTGLFLTLLAIGNSIYFFGRSHEHNIINIAIVLLFLFFFLLDLATRLLDEVPAGSPAVSFLQLQGARIAAIALIAIILVSYSQNIGLRAYVQLQNVASGKMTYQTITIPPGFYGYIAKINEVTGNSRKVFFIDDKDFAFYYYGGFSLSGYCNPFMTWLFTKDLHRHLQKLLDSGYNLVCSPDYEYLLEGLTYHSTKLVGDTKVIAKGTAPATKP
jgi:hypothetical protein